MMFRYFWLPALLAGALAPARAETALEVQSWCRAVANTEPRADGTVNVGPGFEDGFCWGAFATFQTLSASITPSRQFLLYFCPPAGATRLQYVQIFMRYAAQHPELAHRDFVLVAYEGLLSAFPCTR
jgi:Rap1a immunity proteins